MSENFLGSGTQSSEMGVPNTSMVGSGAMPPNNSICYAGGSLQIPPSLGSQANNNHNSISDEKLSDRLIQIALYQQFESPPSANGGDVSSAREAFADIEFANSGTIPFRHLQRLLKPEDQETIGQLFSSDAQATLSIDAFVAFVEKAAEIKRLQGAGATSVAETE